NSAEAGGKAECGAASLQAADQAGFHWSAQRGRESRKRGVRRTSTLGRRQGSVLGVPREASAQFREDGGTRRSRIGPCRCHKGRCQCPHTKTGQKQRRIPACCGAPPRPVGRRREARSKRWDSSATCGAAAKPSKRRSCLCSATSAKGRRSCASTRNA